MGVENLEREINWRAQRRWGSGRGWALESAQNIVLSMFGPGQIEKMTDYSNELIRMREQGLRGWEGRSARDIIEGLRREHSEGIRLREIFNERVKEVKATLLSD